ncbi:peptide chain release factor N(5)-glutamine methyltransferase [Roseivirga sp.]|uniref:peptide chain release factor N(5)-glutamine methyltransferase n=1 Tax=Roseivirga sp. TaxID=1964215 RepID=UPI003B8D3649
MPKAKSKDLLLRIQNRIGAIYDDRESASIARNYLADRYNLTSIDLAMNQLVDVEEDQLETDLKRLEKKIPYQHIVGFSYFLNRKFFTNEHTLIPRPETEGLVDWVLKDARKIDPIILDIGTGTGCIPISIKLELPNSDCTGVDISSEALTLAKSNAKALSASVNFEHLDILSADLDADSFDVVISNPPYIPLREKTTMHDNVVNHEPHVALFVPDNDPLLFYRVIAEKSFNALKPEGKLYFEIHEAYGKDTCSLLKSIGYADVIMQQDLQGKDRMIRVSKP